MYKNHAPHLHIRDGVYYFVRRVPIDVRQYYASNRISFSLKTKSFATAHRVGNSYGQGYGLEVLHHWMSVLVVDR